MDFNLKYCLCMTESSKYTVKFVTWDVLLYMCFFYWLMNKVVSANGLVE